MQLKKTTLFLLLFCFVLSVGVEAQTVTTKSPNASAVGQRWSAEKAAAWYNQHQWITGANYLPANAINQLEMWQA
jgi:hypothetical protein